MTTFYDGNGNTITISGGGGGGTYGGYQPYSFFEAIGDSLTYGSAYPSKVANILQIPNVVSHAVNGARLIGSGATNMIGQSTQVASTCELCTILGGTNDRDILPNKIGTIGTKDNTTFLGSYQTIIENLLTTNPGMRIVMIKPPRNYVDGDLAYLEKIGECIDELHEYYGIPVIDLFNDLGINEFNYTAYLRFDDRLHFNSDGAEKLATLIAHKLTSIT